MKEDNKDMLEDAKRHVAFPKAKRRGITQDGEPMRFQELEAVPPRGDILQEAKRLVPFPKARRSKNSPSTESFHQRGDVSILAEAKRLVAFPKTKRSVKQVPNQVNCAAAAVRLDETANPNLLPSIMLSEAKAGNWYPRGRVSISGVACLPTQTSQTAAASTTTTTYAARGVNSATSRRSSAMLQEAKAQTFYPRSTAFPGRGGMSTATATTDDSSVDPWQNGAVLPNTADILVKNYAPQLPRRSSVVSDVMLQQASSELTQEEPEALPALRRSCPAAFPYLAAVEASQPGAHAMTLVREGNRFVLMDSQDFQEPNLAVAMPVLQYNQWNTPHAIPMTATSIRRSIKSKKKNSKMILLLGPLLFLGGLLASTLCGSGLCSAKNTIAKEETVTSSTTGPFHRSEVEIMDIKSELCSALGDNFFDGAVTEDFQDFLPHQDVLQLSREKAFDWIIYTDPLQLGAYQSQHLLQRFVLALFYYYTSLFEPWAECNIPGESESIYCYYPEGGETSKIWGNHWLSGFDECMWAGVFCSNDENDGSIIELVLNSNNLNGPLPWELFQLTSLSHIVLQDNRLSGTLPTQLGNLTVVGLQKNKLEGTMPPELFTGKSLGASVVDSTTSRLMNLGKKRLYLHGNLLTGTIPTEVGVSHWHTMYLSDNQLSGSMPMELYDASSLVTFGIKQNKEITGTLPSEISQLTNLVLLFLAGTGLSGMIPSELGLLTRLTTLELANSNLGGTIPEDLYEGLSSLSWIDVSGCHFGGSISPSMGLWTGLRSFDIADNNFSGTLPNEIGTLTQLLNIRLNGNAFADASIPDFLCVLKNAAQTWQLAADCAPDATTGIPLMGCASTCCTVCCDPNTGICQAN